MNDEDLVAVMVGPDTPEDAVASFKTSAKNVAVRYEPSKSYRSEMLAFRLAERLSEVGHDVSCLPDESFVYDAEMINL